jgi:hypothetical protein
MNADWFGFRFVLSPEKPKVDVPEVCLFGFLFFALLFLKKNRWQGSFVSSNAYGLWYRRRTTCA